MKHLIAFQNYLKELPVPGILKDLYTFCSKFLHTTLPDKVFIDIDEYTPDQVIPSLLHLCVDFFILLVEGEGGGSSCKDYPVKYVVARSAKLREYVCGAGEGGDDLSLSWVRWMRTRPE
jgi:hypothetical protein